VKSAENKIMTSLEKNEQQFRWGYRDGIEERVLNCPRTIGKNPLYNLGYLFGVLDWIRGVDDVENRLKKSKNAVDFSLPWD